MFWSQVAESTKPATADTGTRRRRTPVQKRSRDRVDAILAAARDLVVEHGSDALRMSEVAARAGIPIGSLYQYFPDKPAILRELSLQLMARVRETLAGGLEGISSKTEALERIDMILAQYYDLFLNEPDIRDVWAATQSDKELQRLDIEDSRENGRLIYEAMKHLVQPRHRRRLRAATFLHAHLVGAGVRLAISVHRAEGDRLVGELRRSVRCAIDAILDDDTAGAGHRT